MHQNMLFILIVSQIFKHVIQECENEGHKAVVNCFDMNTRYPKKYKPK